MGGRFTSCVFALAVLALAGCGGGTSIEPAPVQQEGITLSVIKTPSGTPTGVRVSWTRVDDPDVGGYYIYRDVATIPAGDPTGHDSLRVNNGDMIDQSGNGSETLTFDDVFNPAVGETFYYRMTVVNQTDDESNFSNEENITIGEHTIDDVTQAGGSIGDTVTITGTHFGAARNGDLVYFTDSSGSTTVAAAAGDYISWDQTQIEVKIPYGAADGPVAVSINSNGVTSVDEIDYNEPAITNLNPTEDYVQNGYVIITGTDFGPAPSSGGSSTNVYFGATAAQTSDFDQANWSTTQIKVKVPAAATGMGVNVHVSVAGNNSGNSSFTILPHINNVNPTSATTGSSVTVNGTNFGATQGTGTVTVKGFSTTPTAWSNTSISFPIPANAVDGNIVVTRSDGKPTSIAFDVIPTISSLDPVRREVGQQLTITGSGFGTAQNGGVVTFLGGSNPDTDAVSYVSWGATQIVVVVPVGAKTGQVKVTVNDTSVGSNQDSVTSSGSVQVLLPPPVIGGTGQI
jgi:hypothetical protein